MLLLEISYSLDILYILLIFIILLLLIFTFSYKFLKKILFLFDAEFAHNIVVRSIQLIFLIKPLKWLIKKNYTVSDSRLNREVFGLKFRNPVGLAAGFDKNANYIEEFKNFGFGFIEIGTVTPLPQEGNLKPRLFRLIGDNAILNRMGFNNDGIEAVISRLRRLKNNKVIIGGNIGKNKDTLNENAKKDYEICFQKLFPYVDYFVVNVSSPNTPNLRELQQKEPLRELLLSIQSLNNNNFKKKPILLKISPDLNQNQIDEIIEIVKLTKLDGIIATNTTIKRDNLNLCKEKVKLKGNGGISGIPLKDRSTQVIKYIYKKSNGSIPIIGVGGIHSEKDALEKLEAGASLVQIYTGFIYEGPSLIKKINKLLLNENN